jgi:hypothetical protein
MLQRRCVWITLALWLSVSHPAIAQSTGPDSVILKRCFIAEKS